MTARILIVIGALIVFGGLNWQIAAKERLRANGRTMYLAMGPRDPRSLMQGDYMALNFDLARQVGSSVDLAYDQQYVAVLQLNDRGIGTAVRLEDGRPLSANEVRFRFRVRHGSVWLGTNAFFFQEGDEERFRLARFGEFRVSAEGEALLVDLRDAELKTMMRPARKQYPR